MPLLLDQSPFSAPVAAAPMAFATKCTASAYAKLAGPDSIASVKRTQLVVLASRRSRSSKIRALVYAKYRPLHANACCRACKPGKRCVAMLPSVVTTCGSGVCHIRTTLLLGIARTASRFTNTSRALLTRPTSHQSRPSPSAVVRFSQRLQHTKGRTQSLMRMLLHSL